MNSSLRFGMIGYTGLITTLAIAYYFPWGLLNIPFVVIMGLAFAFAGWALTPKADAQTDASAPSPRGPPTSTTLEELKVSADTVRELAKTRGDGDLSVDMPGVSLRLGKPRGTPSPDEGLPSTDSGTVETVN